MRAIKAGLLSGKVYKLSIGTFLLSMEGFGKAVVMAADILTYIFKGNVSLKSTVLQMVEVGWRSSPIIVLTSFFTGMVLSLQVGSVTSNIFNEPVYIGTITGLSLVMELSPVLTAVVVCGRVGAAITAELSTMKVTEQLDALYMLGTNPVKYPAVSRFLACFFMLPMLTVIANVVGICGGMIFAVSLWEFSPALYWSEVLDFIRVSTFFHGFIKSFFFAVIIAIIACHKGFNAKNGADGVGKATTSSVMHSIVFILISDYFLTSLLFALRIK
jgi:phospholipid/cholesterol/gamma-HCH transport system permease protein